MGHRSGSFGAPTRPHMSQNTKDPHAAFKKRIYVNPGEWALFLKVCDLRDKSPSEVLRKKVKAEVRLNAVMLRKAGVKLPESLFAK